MSDTNSKDLAVMPNNEYTQFISKFNDLLKQDRYIARSDYKDLISEYKSFYEDLIVYNKSEAVLEVYSKEINTSIDILKKFIEIYERVSW